MSKLWSIPVITAYLYAATVLAQFGYVSHFGIPSDFVEASLRGNIIYFFNLFQIGFGVIGAMNWWALIAIALVVTIILLMCWGNYRYKYFFSICGTAILGLFLWGSYSFGGFMASQTGRFFALSENCSFESTSTRYIIPTFFGTKAILLPYDMDNQKIQEGFLVREVSEMPCLIQQLGVGAVVRNQETVFAADHERVSAGDEQAVQNTQCDFTFKIPKDWNVYGILGESKILSPEDGRVNEEWLKSPDGQAPAEEGSAGPALGPDARSLHISCQDTGKIDDLKSSAVKTIKINGRDAYEFADKGKMLDGSLFTNYRLVVEAEKITEIHLGQTEYDDLSETIKQIIQSISFED